MKSVDINRPYLLPYPEQPDSSDATRSARRKRFQSMVAAIAAGEYPFGRDLVRYYRSLRQFIEVSQELLEYEQGDAELLSKEFGDLWRTEYATQIQSLATFAGLVEVFLEQGYEGWIEAAVRVAEDQHGSESDDCANSSVKRVSA